MTRYIKLDNASGCDILIKNLVRQAANVAATAIGLSCRLCAALLADAVLDLGETPLANAYVRAEDLERPDPSYPLRLLLCPQCGLIQLEAAASPEAIFSSYHYFSSYSSTLLRHSQRFAGSVVERLGLTAGDLVVEVASNDGYLLQYFQAAGLDVLGIEPAANVARVARERGIPTISRFFGAEAASELVRAGRAPRLIVANNVVAHVPDLNDFLSGLSALLACGATLSLEFHHLLRLVEGGQFDNIYHEHFQYFSLASLTTALERHGLQVVDVEELTTQGGSLRVYARRADSDLAAPSPAVTAVLAREAAARLTDPETFHALARRVSQQREALLAFLVDVKRSGRKAVGFGAAAKGNTLLNCCGIHADLMDYVVDSSPHKQGLFLPGSHIPIVSPETVARTRPDYLVILPWNLRAEVMAEMAQIRSWGGRFVVPGPRLEILE